MRRLVWPAGRPFVRAHEHAFGSTEFDGRATGDRRFSPLVLDGGLVPVIYAGTDDRTAAAETIFHRLPGRGRPRRVPLDRYRAWQWSRVHSARDLVLLPLDSSLPDAAALVDGDELTYAGSRGRAGELLAHHPDVDGFAWASRQLHDQPSSVTVEPDTDDLCLLVLAPGPGRAGGIERHELAADGPAVPFATPVGQERLDLIGDALDVTVVRA